MNSQTENLGIGPVLFVVFHVITCTFGSIISTVINRYYVFSVSLVGFVHVLSICNIFCLINHANDLSRERD